MTFTVDHLLPAALEFIPVPQDAIVLDTQCQMRKQAEPLDTMETSAATEGDQASPELHNDSVLLPDNIPVLSSAGHRSLRFHNKPKRLIEELYGTAHFQLDARVHQLVSEWLILSFTSIKTRVFNPFTRKHALACLCARANS